MNPGKIALGLVLLAAAWAGWTYLNQGVQVRDLYAGGEPTPLNHPDSLTRTQVSKDVSYLKLALARSYAGTYLYPDLVKNVSGELDTLPNDPDVKTWAGFVERLNKILGALPDGHLVADSLEQQLQRWAFESEIAAPESESPIFEFDVRNVDGRRIFVAKFSSFAIYDSAAIDGIVQQFKDKLAQADSLLIDLRGNRGGSLDLALKLASTLWGEQYRDGRSPIQDFPTPIARRAVIYSPGTLAVLANWRSLQKSYLKRSLASRGRIGPLVTLKDRFDRIMRGGYSIETHVKSELPEVLYDEDNHQMYLYVDPAKKGFTKRIAIVTDPACASACERFLEALEAHPSATTLGEKTAGAAQFGSVGLLILPESRIGIPIATDYEQYKDDRKIERTGYLPKIATAPGEDTFVRAWEFLRTAPAGTVVSQATK